MPEPLTLAEFKARLAERSAREALGIQLTDAEALRVVADDQQVAELYVQMRTGAFTSEGTAHPVAHAAPAAAPEAGPRPTVPFYRRPVVIAVTVAAAVVLVAAGVVGFNVLSEQARMQRYAEIIREDTRLSENYRTIDGDSLEATYNINCAKAREGWSITDEVAASSRSWEGFAADTSKVSRDQYIRNNVATFEAALEVCG